MSIAVIYCRKYEPQHLVDELRANLAWADCFVERDERSQGELWSVRRERNQKLIRQAREESDADWFLLMDPDERMQNGAEDEIREATEGPIGFRYSFPLRELWTPDQYRTDGIWGQKTRRRLFHRTRPAPYRIFKLSSVMYHLKMIEPENRVLRAKVHNRANTWDNKKQGFDYLAEEAGLVLQQVLPHEGYYPPYTPYKFSVPEELL